MGRACTKSRLREVHRHRLHLLAFNDGGGSRDRNLPRRSIDTCRTKDTSDLDIRARHAREGCRECRLDITAIVAVDILEADLALYRIGLTAVIEDEGNRLRSLLREDSFRIHLSCEAIKHICIAEACITYCMQPTPSRSDSHRTGIRLCLWRKVYRECDTLASRGSLVHNGAIFLSTRSEAKA